MLMFQNGLFATFIPEILMVLGYLLCIVAPSINAADKAPAELNSQTVTISTVERIQSATYTVSTADFHYAHLAEVLEQSPICYPPDADKTVGFSDLLFHTSDGLSFVQFSRPPPAFLL